MLHAPWVYLAVFVAWDMSPEEAADALERHARAVLAGDKPLEPWQPCMFAAAPDT